MQKSIPEFFGDLRMSPPFVFRELEHVLIPEFGDLILGIQHQQRSSGKRQEQIPRYARDDSAAAEASCLRRIDPPAARRQAASLGKTTEERKIRKTSAKDGAPARSKPKASALKRWSYIKSTTKTSHSA
jgi:hypothetical protein